MRDSVGPSALGAVDLAGAGEGEPAGRAQPATKAADASESNPMRIRVIAGPQPNRSSESRILRGSSFVRLAVKTRSQRALL
jgi:hypothetical protein